MLCSQLLAFFVFFKKKALCICMHVYTIQEACSLRLVINYNTNSYLWTRSLLILFALNNFIKKDYNWRYFLYLNLCIFFTYWLVIPVHNIKNLTSLIEDLANVRQSEHSWSNTFLKLRICRYKIHRDGFACSTQLLHGWVHSVVVYMFNKQKTPGSYLGEDTSPIMVATGGSNQ